MIDFSLLKTIPADESHYDFLFQLKKAAMGPYVKQIWGWDEKIQQKHHAADWQEQRPGIILYGNQPIGSILVTSEDNHNHVGRFYILPEFQNKGIGTHILKDVLVKADKAKQSTTLAVLRINPAISLYKRHGFTVMGSNEHQYLMERKPGGKAVGYQAVIFDLGGTLTYNTAWSEYVNAAKEVSLAISAPVDDFVRIWFEQAEGLGLGKYPTYQDFIKHICRQLTLTVPENLIDKAAVISLAMARRHLTTPRNGAIELLTDLKTNGYKLGLISDCGPDVTTVWNETPFAPYFDVTIFSCEAGMNKGDPRIFRIALEKLTVKPEKCMYIADGMRNELSNATSLGMQAVQLLVPGEIDDSPIRENWQGLKISSLKEVLNLVGK